MSISYLTNQENSRKAGGEFPPPWQVHALKGFTKIYKMVRGQLSANLGRNNYENHRYSEEFIITVGRGSRIFE